MGQFTDVRRRAVTCQRCAKGVVCPISRKPIRSHYEPEECPHPKGSKFVALRVKAQIYGPPKPHGGSLRWRALHLRALRWDGTSIDAERDFVAHLVDGLTRCTCADHWAEYVASHPLNVTTAGEYFAWTVAAHNAVNRRRGKPELGIREAMELHDDGR